MVVVYWLLKPVNYLSQIELETPRNANRRVVMISSYFNLPFGGWAHCQFPSVTNSGSYLGKIENGRDLLVWIGRFQIVLARSTKKGRGAGAVPCGFDEIDTSGCPPTERLYRTLRSALAYRG